tara:strand:+ start:656 stop:1048 length:393 start_codon:yes stop_codon:yes gene_type:complete
MKTIEPNSLQAVVLFILYICAQDGEISDDELAELAAELPILKKLYFDFYGEFIDFDLNQILSDLYALMQPISQLTSAKVTDEETALIESHLTDPKVQDVALLAARSAARVDSFHEKEEAKYNYWSKSWGI